MSAPKVILAIDPGTSKCGFALARREPSGKVTLLWRAIRPPERLIDTVAEAESVEQPVMVVVGSGTGSKTVVAALRDARPGLSILIVDERDTTLEARARYWEHIKRPWWRRLLPATLQLPPEPVDDFVALLLAERVLAD